jgi:hypothetical protein
MPTTQTLSFTLRPCLARADLQAACDVRAEAYGRQLPGLRQAFGAPEAIDALPGTEVLLCRDKTAGTAMGTARLHFSQDQPLQIDASLTLPDWLAGSRRAEITRLAVLAGADPLTRLALMKASYQLCMARGIDWLVIGARKPALIRTYQRLGFVDLLGPQTMLPLAHAGGLPHRILVFDVARAHATWPASQHPLYAFMVETEHPDIAALPSRSEQVTAAIQGSAALSELRQHAHQVLQSEGLGEEIVHAGLETFGPAELGHGSGQRDHRHPGQAEYRLLQANLAGGLVAVHHRHPAVHQ